MNYTKFDWQLPSSIARAIRFEHWTHSPEVILVLWLTAHMSHTCKTSHLFAPLAVRVKVGCSAFPLYTPTKPLIRLYFKYKTVWIPKLKDGILRWLFAGTLKFKYRLPNCISRSASRWQLSWVIGKQQEKIILYYLSQFHTPCLYLKARPVPGGPVPSWLVPALLNSVAASWDIRNWRHGEPGSKSLSPPLWLRRMCMLVHHLHKLKHGRKSSVNFSWIYL